jgi:Protein of unknown function (DUF3617)
MKQLGAACFLVLIGVAPALAADFPARKPGLWQTNTTTASGHTISIQECVDARTDQMMQARFGAMPQRNCAKRDMHKSGDTITVDSVCTIAGRTTTHHMVITGSFDSGYTMTMTSQTQGMPDPRSVKMTAKWVGPCAAGQRPGDMIMPGGQTMNIFSQGAAPGAPGGAMAPHQ